MSALWSSLSHASCLMSSENQTFCTVTLNYLPTICAFCGIFFNLAFIVSRFGVNVFGGAKFFHVLVIHSSLFEQGGEKRRHDPKRKIPKAEVAEIFLWNCQIGSPTSSQYNINNAFCVQNGHAFSSSFLYKTKTKTGKVWFTFLCSFCFTVAF